MKTDRLVVNGKIAAYTNTLADNLVKDGGSEKLVEVRNQIRLLIRQMRSNPQLIQVLKNDTLEEGALSELFHNAFKDFDPTLVEVTSFMAEQHDMELLPRVYHAFDQKLADDHNLVTVDVTTTVELDDHLRELIKTKVQNEIGKDAIINERINKDMLGGIVMTVQGKRIDASVRAQLNKARIELKKNTMEVKASD